MQHETAPVLTADRQRQLQSNPLAAVTVAFELVDEDAAFLAWTTTPWTLPSNLALCVHPKFTYAKFRGEPSRLYGTECD